MEWNRNGVILVAVLEKIKAVREIYNASKIEWEIVQGKERTLVEKEKENIQFRVEYTMAVNMYLFRTGLAS